jgi:hypothetical protein
MFCRDPIKLILIFYQFSIEFIGFVSEPFIFIFFQLSLLVLLFP